VITEDASVFLADHGEDGLLDGAAVRVIFGSPYAALPSDGMGMADSRPRALIASDSVPADASTDTEDVVLELTEAATLRPGFPDRYAVVEVQPDGTGLFSTLILREAAPAPAPPPP
jgi:hypothetical protein